MTTEVNKIESNIFIMMKFECLPNEIFVECFEYLNGIDLFYSFNQLNNRFNQLIRNVPLYLNFEAVDKSTFNQLCSTIFFNPDIKLRIVGLKLSNEYANEQVETFLSCFPVNRYPHVRSLTLLGLYPADVEPVAFMLLWLTNLSYLSVPNMIGPDGPCQVMSALQISKVKTLSMSHLRFDLDFTPEMTTITNLTMSFCFPVYLFQLLAYTPMLKYLNIKSIGVNQFCGNNSINENFEVKYLKVLIIQKYHDTLERLEILLNKTMNLKSFTLIIKLINMSEIAADYWQPLITTSLPHLEVFNFQFAVIFHEYYEHILDGFQEFQTDFWCKQHHWYTMLEIHEDIALIYTVPYVWNKYELIVSTTKFSDSCLDKLNMFNNVTNLIVLARAISDDFQYYFSNVKTLQFTNQTTFANDFTAFELTMEQIICLTKIINFSNLKILKIWRGCRMKSSILLQILKEASQLSSLVIEKSMLISFFDNNELNEYLNPMIDELNIDRCSENPFLISNELDLFCKIFSNLKRLECCIDKPDDFLFLINHLPKLTHITAHYSSRTYKDEICQQLRKTAAKRNLNCMFYIVRKT